MTSTTVQHSSERGDLLTLTSTSTSGLIQESKSAYLRWREGGAHVDRSEVYWPWLKVGVKA